MNTQYALTARIPRPRRSARSFLALSVAAAGAVSCRDARDVTTPVADVPPGPPVALAMLLPGGSVYPDSLVGDVILPQRMPVQVVWVDSARHQVGAPVVATWRSSDPAVVSVAVSSDGLHAELTGLKPGIAEVTAEVHDGTTRRVVWTWRIKGPAVALALMLPARAPVADSLVGSLGAVVRDSLTSFVTLPRRTEVQATLVDAAGLLVDWPLRARWRSSDTTVVSVGFASLSRSGNDSLVTVLTGRKVGKADLTAEVEDGTTSRRFVWHWIITR